MSVVLSELVSPTHTAVLTMEVQRAVIGDLSTFPELAEAAAATARRLLVQTWPASDEADIHALAEDFELINADIEADDLAKYESDGTNLNAAANVVRAELGLPSVR